jgi:fido (protein-threonine AMPylation protein)
VSDDTAHSAVQKREADLVRLRIGELHEKPIQGNFDAEHLKATHAYIFQDLPEHQPGIIRERTEERWVKLRALEGKLPSHVVHYAHEDIEKKLAKTLRNLRGPSVLEGQPVGIAAVRLADLYGDLDYAHGFYEGNSRTLREFTRELALAAGFTLDWIQTDIGAPERNELYVARDLAVLERAYPGLTPERAMATDDRAEYEASFVIAELRRKVGDRTLAVIISEKLAKI